MNNSTLTRFDTEDGIEILIDETTGESFCSLKGYARMSGKDKSTISRRLHGGAYEAPKTAQAPTSGGIQAVVLITEDQIVEWLPKDNPVAASVLLKLGVRMALHAMVGFSFRSSAASQQQQQQQQPTPPSADLQRLAALAIDLATVPGAADLFKLLAAQQQQHVTLAPVEPERTALCDDVATLGGFFEGVVVPQSYADATPTTHPFYSPEDRLRRLSQSILRLSKRKGFVTAKMVRYCISSKINPNVAEIRAVFTALVAENRGEVQGTASYMAFRAFGAKTAPAQLINAPEHGRQALIREGILKLSMLRGIVNTNDAQAALKHTVRVPAPGEIRVMMKALAKAGEGRVYGSGVHLRFIANR